MAGGVIFSEKPTAQRRILIAGWRQWADAGAVSSGLPEYLVRLTGARKIGTLPSGGFYLFQIPGAHDLARPVVRFEAGFPASLEAPENDFYYAGDEQSGLVIFLGDEPQLDVERYVGALLDAAQELGVERIIGVGGVYAEVPYDKERMISAIYSLPELKPELDSLAVSLSDYHGGASIGSYVCRRSADRGLTYLGLYAFAPAFNFSSLASTPNGLRIEQDYTAWLGIVRRLQAIFQLNLDLSDLEKKSQELEAAMDAQVDELEATVSGGGIREYFRQIAAEFHEVRFEPGEFFWEEELKRLFDKLEDDDGE